MSASQAADAAVVASDDQRHQHELPALHMTDCRDWPCLDMAAMVISPGTPPCHPNPHPAAADVTSLQSEEISVVELACRPIPQSRRVGVTGTNAKSMTTPLNGLCLTFSVRAHAIGGNIGDPACSLDDPGKDGVLLRVLSSYYLETTPSLAPGISILLNIIPDHPDRHGGMNAYIAAPTAVLYRLRTECLAFIGDGDEAVKMLSAATRKRRIKTMISGPDDAPDAQRHSASLSGLHNAETAAAAAFALSALRLHIPTSNRGGKTYATPPHRLRTVAHWS